jgi:hypothetical protein
MLVWRSAFQLLNLVRCPRLHTTTLAAIRQSGLEVFDDFGGNVNSSRFKRFNDVTLQRPRSDMSNIKGVLPKSSLS